MNLRDDLQLIYDWIPENSRVLDLGCGKGELLSALVRNKHCSGYGVEIDTEGVLASMERGINVIQADLEQGLQDFDSNSFDILVLSQTIQAMQNTENILRDLTRVAKQAIVSFPNFGYWRNRVQLGLTGHMPVSERMPYQWYNTPNIHFCTIVDFELLCVKNGIHILERAVMTKGKRVNTLPNLLGSLAFYRVG
ncbi:MULTISPECIES: methionine biosynthesis protein MetW [Neisseria]|uniref:Methionine biosynthesis MetW n=2 Tax=Neisseria TaxID=482 RepID=A0A448DAA6_9NEIS|nr:MULTISPECIES: methionine biosynthesis protein MetW [Neisseria]EGZ45507.1 ribosomal RNA large subunit methyltransferase J [Neisseria wadsworthii 9715]OSI12686.1 methionine biosynthesis protein MetW [Neisseria canis]QMT35307.1 methionine biosynthesis protein MetW [Neisseria wadsworthii]VEF02640.1 methionine biosynthesis MetW [Neisseria canis]